ncbi:hypothetical protein BN2476_500169 [Paraburkholderia piptadeniae]|uniref:Uncharacterized protein n=1 Tax=Paraburkholderia piptadeniae TaxID=1701573 RepID=A0A1N7SG66_9BURK|nr:hypothetical protein BN2476_500169 [Paraburkholderia piptadeniae]
MLALALGIRLAVLCRREINRAKV